MQTPKTRRIRGNPWVLRSLLVLLILAVGTAVFLLARGRAEPANVKEPGVAVLPKAKSGYENRAIWQTGPAQRGQSAKALTIRGTVYEMSGKPVAGVRLTASTYQMAGNQSTVAAAAESDSQGHFEMAVRDGTYYVNGEKEGYGAAMTVARGGDEVGILLSKSGTVQGHVKDERGQPIKHFSIDVIGPGPDDMAAPAPFVSKEFKSEDGSYSISQVPHQGVFVRATAAGYAPAISAVLKVEEGKTETADLTLTTGCVMTGTVTDSDGSPLENVFVDAELRKSAGVMGTTSVDAASEGESDAQGRFRLEHVPVGDVMVRAYNGGHAVTNVEMNIDRCEGLAPVLLKMGGGSSLHGTVKDTDGKPMAGAKLTLSHRSTGFVATTTGTDGAYRFDKIPQGGMRLEVQAAEGQRAMMMVGMDEAGHDLEYDITLPAGGKGEIHGRITSGSTPLKGIQVLAVSNVGTGTLSMNQPVTGADGSYRITGLKDGTYIVLLTATGRIAQTKVEDGGSVTVDIDVAFTPPPAKPPERPNRPKADLDTPRNDAPPAGDSSSTPGEAPAPAGER